jgi:hypothetical protein
MELEESSKKLLFAPGTCSELLHRVSAQDAGDLNVVLWVHFPGSPAIGAGTSPALFVFCIV